MYKDGYVVSVFKEGDVLREIDGKVYISSNSEYKVRLRNRNSFECACDLYIDSKKVSNLGEIIIPENGVIDLERFIDHSLTDGKKFLFVSDSDNRVEDKGEPENGWIEARFYRIRPQTTNYHSDVWFTHTDFTNPTIKYKGTNADWKTSNDSICFCNSSIRDSSYCSLIGSVSDKGATVGGNQSNQKFGTVYKDIDRSQMTIVRLQILPLNKVSEYIKEKTKIDYDWRYCSQCGIIVKRKDKYCRKCGNQLI